MKTLMKNIRRITAFAMALILLCASLDVSAVAVYAEEIAEEECSMTVSANGVVMTANDADTLRSAVISCLYKEDGNYEEECDMTIDLPADAGEELFAAIRSALVEYGNHGVEILVNLTISGAEAIPVGVFGENYTDEEGGVVSQIASICLPDALSIGESAFNSCGSLTTVTASKLQTVGAYAFVNCALASVEMPEVTTIGEYAFEGCALLTSVAFPKVTDIGGRAFYDCSALKTIELTSPEAIVLGDDVFSCVPTADVDLVLNRNKAGEIINGTTWNGYEFNSVCAGYKGDLCVNVVATGGKDSEEKAFTLQIKLSDTSINGKYGDVTFENGEASVVLKNGESVSAVGLPEGITYTVTEDNTSDYKAAKSGDTGTIVKDECQTADFSFEYSASGSAEICSYVILEGKELEGGSFIFRLLDSEGNELQSVTNESDGTIRFEPLSFGENDIDKEFTYTIQIVEPGSDYYVISGEQTVVVNVSDNGDGALNVITSAESRELTVSYVEPAVAQISASVVLNGPHVLEAGMFGFELCDENGRWIGITAGNDANGDIIFEPIEYVEPGNYQYTIHMVDGEVPGYTYDEVIKKVTVIVSRDSETGRLSTAIDSGENGTPVFTCSYSADGNVELRANVTLENKELYKEEFCIQLFDSEGNEIGTASNNKDGIMIFDPIFYELEDIGKEFTYTIKMKNKEYAGYTYDDRQYQITVTVEDNGDGTLKVTALDQNGRDATNSENLDFVCSYEDPGVTVFAGVDMLGTVLKEKCLKLEMVDQNADSKTYGEVIATAKNGVSESERAEDFGAITSAATFEFPALFYTHDDIGKTFYYVVKMVDENKLGYTYDDAKLGIAVTVEEGAHGTLDVTAVDENGNDVTNSDSIHLRFECEYEVSGEVTVCGKVKLSGTVLEEGACTFQLIDRNGDWNDGEIIDSVTNGSPESKQNEDTGEITSEATFEFVPLQYDQDDVEKTFHYGVRMVNDGKKGYIYDNTEYEITINVSDNGDGTLKVTALNQDDEDVILSTGENLELVLRYEATGQGAIRAKVALDGCELKEDMFAFTLWEYNPVTGECGKVQLDEARNKEDGTVEFSPVTISQNAVSINPDKPGRAYYAVKMVNEEKPGYIYDSEEKVVILNVSDNGDGTLQITEGDAADFCCSYKATGSITLGASVSCEEYGLIENEFEFQICDSEGNVLRTAKNKKDGTVNFVPIEYNQDDVGTITYRIKQVEGTDSLIEYDTTEKTIRVEVIDNGDGTLSVNSEGDACFNNSVNSLEPEADIYCLNNARHLLWFAKRVNAEETALNAKLTGDIDLTGFDWTIMSSFAGTFDGDGHTISGLNGHKAYTENTHGFIRILADGGVVKNLTFTEADIFNHEGSGAISAVIVYTNNGTVENCVVKSSLIQLGNYDALGVVVGVNGGTIRNCASISNKVKRRYSGEGNKAASVFVWSNVTNAIIENCIVYDCTYEDASANYAFTKSNTGTITNCYYYESSETISDTVATAKTAEAFASGEVAYLLNGKKTDGTQSWYQTLETDSYPVPDNTHGTVYYGYADCRNMTYANTELSKDKPEHSWKCEPDEANTNKMTFSCTTDGCTKGGTITVTAPEGAIYDGNNHTATVTVETEENEELIATPVITYDSLTEGVELVDGKPVNAGTYDAKVTFDGVLSYQEFEIKKAILDVTGVTATGRTYEKGNASVVITEVALEGVADLDAVSVDVTGLKGTLSGANAGDYTEVTLPELKLSGSDKDNYVLTQPSKAVPTNVTISPQATGTAQNVTKKYLFSQENADTINLVSLLPKDCGTVVSYGTPVVDGNVTYKVAPSIEEGTLIYTVADGLAGNTGTITIDAKTQNYTSVPITISVALVDQIPIMQQTEVTLKDESQKLTYGQKLSVLELTEVVFKGTDGETVTGTLQWKNGDSIPTVDTKKASWEFVPSASYNDKYATAEGELTISVVPATPVVDTLPTVNAITYHPDTTLADIALSGGKMNGIADELNGTWAWKDTTICPKAGDNTYVAVFTPEDSTNYKTKEVDITVSVAKATPYIKTAVAADAVTYGEALKDSALSGGAVQYSETDETAVAGSWSWKEVTTKPIVADSNVTQYDVVFTPTDAENYNKVETKITLTVNKAETTPNMPESTMSALYSQKTVGALELPEGWVWNEADSAKELAVDVAVEATAIYNGADKGNYVTESVTISITRQACDHEESDILYTGEGEKAPTCTVDGIGHTECTKCKEPMQTNVTVEASGHTGGTATCKNKAECSTCHEGYGELDKNNHAGETEVKDAKEATCGEEGYTGDTYCKDCGAKIATGTKIDKSTAHTWDNGVVTKEATATEKGEKTYTCSVCKTTKKEEIPALGAPKVGEEIASEDGSATYKVTEAGENGNSVTYEAPTDKNQATVVVPATVTINNITYNVTTISDTAFAGNKKLTSVTIGDNVTGFSANTFKGCSNLKTVDVGNGVTSIPANTFKNFKKLTTVKMGTGVKTIGKNAFYGCKKLKNLTLGKNVVTIGDKAFYKCTSLTKVTIPSKVKTIGKSTFEGCKALKTITIGKSVTKIGSKAFYGCSKTKTLTIKSSKLTTKKIGSKAFTKTPKNMTVKVPKKKFDAYKTMLMKRGVNKKARFKKS